MNPPTKAPKPPSFPHIPQKHKHNLKLNHTHSELSTVNISWLSMASSILSSMSQGKAVHAFGMLCLMLLVQKSGALQFNIGDSNGWTVPTNETSFSFNKWAERTRFRVGDSLLFVYKPDHDSVLQVSKEDYDNCNTASPIVKYDDGHSVFTFNKSGPHYFISGNKDNCHKDEKMIIVVMGNRSTPPASPPSSGDVPAPTPSGDHAPAGDESPPSNRTPSPAKSTPSEKNAASSIFTTSIAIFGAVFATSSLAMVL